MKAINRRGLVILFVAIFGIVFFAWPVLASETNGTINTANKYAWSNKVGWINFGVTSGNVAIADTAITGYAWSSNYGWINLAPTMSGVVNNSEGALSGQAWGENLGWIDFSGVTINSSGQFTGTATGDIVGTINFDCSTCNVSTDWRPASSRASVTPASVGSTVGSALPSSPIPSDSAIIINDGANKTYDSKVSLTLKGDSLTSFVWVSEQSNFADAQKVNYQSGWPYIQSDWTLSAGYGLKKVYAKFCNYQGSCGQVVEDSIEYARLEQTPLPDAGVASSTVDADQTSALIPTPVGVESSASSGIIDKISQGLGKLISKIDLLVPDFLKPWKKEQEQKVQDVKQFVDLRTPSSMSGLWNLLPPEPIRLYVFAPLPEEFRALAQKFPSLNSLFKDTGVDKMQDLRKLASVQVKIPSLSKSIGLSNVYIDAPAFAPLSNLPIEKLSSDLKLKIPTDMVFARSASQLVDFGTVLSLSSNGEAEQRLKAISGKKLYLSIKPEFEAEKVNGYLTFVSRDKQTAKIDSGLIGAILQKLKLIETALAKDNLIASSIENKLLIQEFNYQDSDHDGIYIAEIYSPVPVGEYEVLTEIIYKDKTLGSKLFRLITVVDPEGYVYEKVKGNELRINGALVSLYWLNIQTKQYELWPAEKYQQTNGQITDARGSYSFLVPPGSYYLQASAPGYNDYKSALFKVEEGEGVHMNIELESQSWWTKAWDWKTWVIVLLVAVLLFVLEQEFKGKIKKH